MAEGNEQVNGDGVRFSVKEIVTDLRAELASMSREFTSTLDRIETKLDAKADIAAVQSLSTQVQNILINGTIQSQRAEKDVKDLQGAVYLSEQRQAHRDERRGEQVDALRGLVTEAIATNKEGVAAMKDHEGRLRALETRFTGIAALAVTSVLGGVAVIIWKVIFK